MQFTLPYPPSVNTYWRKTMRGNRPNTYISEEGKAFRENVKAIVLESNDRDMFVCPVELSVILHAKDRRARDIDNCLKALMDSLTHAGVWDDDNRVDKLTVIRGEIDREDPRAEVLIERIQQ